MTAAAAPGHEPGTYRASGAQLVAARRRAGLSQEQLAELVGVDVSTCRRWERGGRPLNRHRSALANALRLTLRDLDAVLDGRALIPPSFGQLDNGQALDEATTGARAAMEAFRIADRAGVGPDLFADASAYAQTYASRLITAGGSSGPILVAIAGLTELVGWLAHDAGPGDRLAAQYFGRSRDLALAGGDLQLAAHAGASLAHLLVANGDGSGALDAADRALIDLGSSARPGQVDAQLHSMRARAFAQLRQAGEARASLRRAADHLDRNTVDRSPWIPPFDAASLAAETARALGAIGDHRAAIAEALVIEEHRVDGSRARALGDIRRAVCMVPLGDADQAAAIGSKVAREPWAVRSTALAAALDELEASLSGYASSASVRDFFETRRN